MSKAIPSLNMEYENQSLQLFQKIEPLFNEVDSADIKVQKIFEEYSNFYKEIVEQQNQKRDMWIHERKYVQACWITKELQETLGQQVYKLWENVKILEEGRVKIIS